MSSLKENTSLYKNILFYKGLPLEELPKRATPLLFEEDIKQVCKNKTIWVAGGDVELRKTLEPLISLLDNVVTRLSRF